MTLTTTPQTDEFHGYAKAMSSQACSICYGLGTRPGRAGGKTTCHCVYRNVFDACHAQWMNCRNMHGTNLRCSSRSVEQTAEYGDKKFGCSIYHRSSSNGNFICDFELIAFRILNGGLSRTQLLEANLEESRDSKLFRMHFLLDLDWKICTRKLGIDRGTFFHDVYSVKSLVGKAYLETQPYPLFPIDAYRAQTKRGETPKVVCISKPEADKEAARKKFGQLFKFQTLAVAA